MIIEINKTIKDDPLKYNNSDIIKSFFAPLYYCHSTPPSSYEVVVTNLVNLFDKNK